MDLWVMLVYAALPLLAVAAHLAWRARRERVHAAQLADAQAAGLNEPASLHPVVDPVRLADAGAIVILSGGLRDYAPEYGGPTVNRVTLERVRYGARLARQSGEPSRNNSRQP